MSNDSQELVRNRPSDQPGFRRIPPLIDQEASPVVDWKIVDSRIDEEVRINDEHAQPFFLACRYSSSSCSRSSKSKSASRFAISTRGRPVLKLGNGGRRAGLGRSDNPLRSSSAASSDIVVPRFVACCFKSRKTGSGMINVVFIRKTICHVWKYVKHGRPWLEAVS